VGITEGQTIGNYRILQKIGTGGMGAVYLAEHPLIGKKVALKVIHRELAGNREVVGRFFNEARAVNKIGNEHIVEVHDFGQSPDGHYFFLMEFLEGRTLAEVLAAERVLPVGRALHVAAQLAEALGAAHAAGIIHRDLKPDNVMLVTRLGDPDFVKILDFGLAKMFEGGAMSNLTAQGVVLGTPQYMSPEACESKRNVDHRTDIYALGVLLYQMLCGEVPFDGGSMGEVLVKQVTQAPPAPRALNPYVPPSVEQIILRCLAKAPDARFPHMAALREALLDSDRYLASSPPVVPAALTRSGPQAQTMFSDGGGAPRPAPAGGPPAPPDRGTGPALALRPPPPSIHSGIADARTAIIDGGLDAQVAAARRTSAVPALQLPAEPQNQTMVIGTPAGYKDRPPRRVWPVVLVLGLLGVVGGGVAAAVMLRGGEDRAAAGVPDAAPVAAAELAPAVAGHPHHPA
jgi:eukaryotic-like serine/threonine-protein kinase